MDMLLRDSLMRHRFAGVREQRLIMDQRTFPGERAEGAWVEGFGTLVYLADARLIGGGQTEEQHHADVDVLSLVVEGRIQHQGSSGHPEQLGPNEVLVKCAGAESVSHSGINPDDTANRFVQIGLLADSGAPSAEVRHHTLPATGLVRVYGGEAGASTGIAGNTLVDIARLESGQSVDVDVPFLAYLVQGRGFANEDPIEEGTLLRGQQLTFDCAEPSLLVLVHMRDARLPPGNNSAAPA